MESTVKFDLSSGTSQPQPYMIPVGEADDRRLDSLGCIFDSRSMDLIKELIIDRNKVRILDVGCGNGRFCRLFAQTFPKSEVVGIDLSQEQIDIARQRSLNGEFEKIQWHQCDVMNLSSLRQNYPEGFDIVRSRFVLSHLPDPIEAANQMRSMVRSGGILIFEEVSSTMRCECKGHEKAFEGFTKMTHLQAQLQHSHSNTAELLQAQFKFTLPLESKVHQFSVQSAEEKMVFRRGVELAIEKIHQMRQPQLFSHFGYTAPALWLEEMKTVECDPNISVTICNYTQLYAKTVP